MSTLPYTLLIVDDFAADRELYRRSLLADSKFTYHPIEAESVAEGLELCANHQIDAVLLDYMLPDGDGLEFLAALSDLYRGNPPPVVMLTGQGSETIAVQAMKLGAHDYLVKRDLTPAILQLTMRTAMLQGRGSANENARLKRQLAQCQERFRISIDNMRDADAALDRFFHISIDLLAIGNADGYFTQLNPAFEQTLGFTNTELMSQPFIDFVHPDDREHTLAGARRLVAGEPMVSCDNRYLCKDGSYRWISWNAISHAPSKIWYGIGHDITDLKREEAQLKQAEATIRQQLEEIETIYRNAPIGMCFVDTDLRYIRINPQLAQINGAPVSAHLGHTFREVLPELVDLVEPLYRQVIESGEAIIDLEVSGTNQAQPGVERYWLASFYPQTDVEGRVIGVNNVVHEITDRKRLELDRIAAEQERDRFFNMSLDMLSISNFEGYFLRLNPAWEEILGFTTAELMARPYLDFIHPDDRASTLAAAEELTAGDVVFKFENRYLCKDGSYRWLSWSSTPYLGQNLIYGIAHDITAEKRSQAALQASERKFSAIFNQTFELIGLITIDGILREINQTALDTIEAQVADVIDREFWDTLWWSHSPQAQSSIKEAIERGAQGEFNRFQMQLPTPIGTVIDIDFSLKPIFDAAGNVTMLLAEGRDITPLKQAERALQESQRKFSAIFEQSFELMGIVSLDGILREVNQAALDSIEARREDIAGQLFWETPWWHTEQLQQQLQAAIARAAHGEFSRYEVQFPHPSGVMLTTDFSLKPVFDETGRVWTIVAEAHDITDRQRSQAELEARNQELDSFVYIVSHDLKAPLRAVANLSEWIEEDIAGSLSPANQQQMKLLRDRVYRMEATIDGLLDYARIGRTDGEIEPVAVSELLAETIATLAPPPTFTIAIAQNLPTIYTNRMLLSQVFANLLGNAVKHHDRADGLIHLGIAERPEFYEFAIADDGPGIALEQHERVFKIFQAVNPQKRTDSTGIGLAIVKKIIEAEGGTIRLESQPGRGTTFYFTWPKRSGRTAVGFVGGAARH